MMPLHHFTEDERRAVCRTTIESLELWLRRLINDQLSGTYGADYLEAAGDHGNHLINSRIRKRLAELHLREPRRYPRLIDAAVLDDEIDIVCNPQLHGRFFADALMLAFPDGPAEARTFLKRLLPVRNALSHANPVSIRQCEQVICYSHDIIDSLKDFYSRKHMAQEYNVPTILVVKDSFGNFLHPNQMIQAASGRIHLEYAGDPRFFLRPGDTLSLEVEIDAAFSSESYILKWQFGSDELNPATAPTHLVIPIEERHVNEMVMVECQVITNKNWHRYRFFDDRVEIGYKVLPPLE